MDVGYRRSVRIDLNADLGEGFGAWTAGDDLTLLGVVTSASIACGFHAGDPTTMRRSCERAAENDVAIGAHVGYADLAGFGRRFLDVAPSDLEADVLYQVAALDGFARAAGSRVSYVKPHGALYHAVATHPGQAAALVAALTAYGSGVVLLHQPDALALRLATDAGLATATEAFADRSYRPDGTLVPRGEPGAVLHDPAEIAARVVALATTATVRTVDGSTVPVAADSVCVHGDTAGAVAIARAVREALVTAGVTLAPFAPSAPSAPSAG